MSATHTRNKAAQADEQFQAALAMARAGETARAMRLLERALHTDQRHRGVRNALGVLRLESGDSTGAIALLKPLARELPDIAGIQLNLGNAMVAAGRANDAVAPLKRATQLDGQSPVAWYGLARALQTAGRVADSEAAYRRTLAIAPTHVDALANLAAACSFQDRYAEGEEAARAALQLAPTHAGAHVNRAVALLAQGCWAEGWAEYEWREATELLGGQRREWAQPRWQGQTVTGQTVLVHAEQGFGDTLQFVRYVPLLRSRGARVVLQCPAALVALLSHAHLADDVIATGMPLPPHDWQVPLTSLPRRLGCVTSDAVYVNDAPYLASVPGRVSALPPARDGARLRVGFVWAGSPTMMNEMHRSCGLAELLPLLRLPDVDWVSLQCGPSSAELVTLPSDVQVHDLSPALHDFADTAAAMAELDVVISTCTSVAHLAGALGRPTWLLLPRIGLDWRWAAHGAEAADTPWYRSVSCARQSIDGQWAPALERVRQALVAAMGTVAAG